MGKLRDWARDPIGSIDTGIRTTGNIVDQTARYTGNMGVDLSHAAGDTLSGAGHLSELFTRPDDYLNRVLAPTFGDKNTPGVWDKYGAWLNVAGPPGQLLYLAGQGLNTGYDYSRSGDDDQLKSNAAQLGTSALAYGTGAGGKLNDALGGGYTGAIGSGATMGAAMTATRPGSNSDDIGKGALIGGAAGGIGYGFGGGGVDANGDPYDEVDRLNFGNTGGKFGSQLTSLGLSQAMQDRDNPYSGLDAWIEQEKQRRAGLSITPTLDSPQLQEKLQGSPLQSLFEPEQKDKRRPFTAGGNQYATSNSQLSQGTVSDAADYAGGYFL